MIPSVRSQTISLSFALLASFACSGSDEIDASVGRDAGARDTGRPDGGDDPNRDAGLDNDAGRDNDGGSPDAGNLGPAGCFEVTADRQATFELQPSVTTRITMTLNSTTPPDAMGERGLLSVYGDTWGDSYFERIVSSSGPVAIDAEIIPGPFRARLSGGGCSPPDQTPYCASREVNVELGASDNTVNFDYSPFDLTFTLDGASFPAAPTGAPNRGVVSFQSPGETTFFSRQFDVPVSGEARVASGGFLDTFDIRYQPRQMCPDVFCGGGSVGTMVLDGTPVNQTVDIATVNVSGTVTQDQSPVPFTALGPGTITFYDNERGRTFGSVPVDSNGAYAVRLIRGRYAVEFAGYDTGPTTPTPANAVFLEDDRDFTADTVADYDLSTVDVDIGLTSNGAPLPSNAMGGLALLEGDSGSIYLQVEDLRTERWARTIVGGVYRARFYAPNDCDPADGLPCVTHDFDTNVDLSSSGARTLDMTSYAVSLTFTARGSQLLDSPESRGHVYLALEDGPVGSSIDLPVTASGPATIDTRLPPGRYRVFYTTPTGSTCAMGLLGSIPCGTTPLGTIDVTGDLSTTIDIASLTVSGRFEIGGAPLAVPAGTAPLLMFVIPSVTSYDAPIAEDGTFEMVVPAGSYDVLYLPADLCGGRDVAAPRPCVNQFVHRCPEN